ncbi:MAG: FAD-dependent oxidoreductase [Anaerobacillus sp.]|uniref:FAD-dependent oxidoreductase n=1 Tax=Anaerobacillus sp. TaxID=1872506 RepID=UPI0039193FAA
MRMNGLISPQLNSDVLVIGGGFSSVSAACEAADNGMKVTLIESRTYLGEELMATLNSWVSSEEYDQINDLFNWKDKKYVKLLENEKEYPIIPDQLKLALEEELLARDIKLIYNARTIGWEKINNLYKVEIVGKFGIKYIYAKHVIDGSENAVSLRGSVSSKPRYQDKVVSSRTFEVSGVNLEALEKQSIEIPKELTPEYKIYKGAYERGHLYIEYTNELQVNSQKNWLNEQEIQSRFLTMDIFKWLKTTHEAFQKARIVNTAHKLSIPPLRRVKSNHNLKGTVRTSFGDIPLRQFYSENGIWVASGAADFPNDISESTFKSPVAMLQIGKAIARHLSAHELVAKVTGSCILPVQKQVVDVLVIGGGTSGASAAIAAARKGSNTLLIEMNTSLGGSGTVGGVDSYWFGRRSGFNLEVIKWVSEVHEWMGITWTGKTAEKWNVEGKMYALLNAAQKAGVEIQFNSVLVQVKKKKNKVIGAVVVTPEGIIEITSEVIIDATGDGDAAVMAGAEHFYGSDRESATMWYSKVPQIKPGVYMNNFTSTVNVGDADDYTRAILSARRRFVGYDHSPYLAVRESRHIVGEVRLTLTDQLTFKKWPDVVNIAFSNHDMKGHTSSEWVRLGLIPPNLEIEVPYRALVPKDIDGLIITGKAISATHDALPAIRMQADLENLGAVCGIAADMAAKQKKELRNLDISELQTNLIEWGIIPESVADRKMQSVKQSKEEMAYWVSQLNDEDKLYEFANMNFIDIHTEPIPIVKVCTAGREIIPLLYKELEDQTSPRRLMAARALAWYGDRAATPILIEYLDPVLELDELPGREAKIKYVHAPPDHGAMPEPAYLLYTLAMVKDDRSISVLERAIDKLKPTKEKFTDVNHGLFYYVDSICHIAERLGLRACIPSLERLHSETLFHNKMNRDVIQQDYFEERMAFLEIVIGRALARCGSKGGLSIIIDYLQDSRNLLVQHAYRELVDISGETLRNDHMEWKQWLSSLEELEPKPWVEPKEMV